MLCFAVIHFLIGIFLNGAKEKLREQKNELENRLASLIRRYKKVTDEADSEEAKVRWKGSIHRSPFHLQIKGQYIGKSFDDISIYASIVCDALWMTKKKR